MDQIDVASVQVVRKGVFDVKEFYLAIYSFIKDALGYSGFSEDDYSQWVKAHGTDIEFHWTFTKKQEDYVNYRLWVECKVRGSRDVKSKVGDLVKDLQNAELEFIVKGVLVLDPGNKWSDHPILKHFQKFYEKVIYRSQIENYTERLWEHVFNVEGEVKAFFELPKLM